MLAPWVHMPCTQIVSQTYQWSSQVRRRMCPRNSNCVPKPGKLPRNAGHLLGTMASGNLRSIRSICCVLIATHLQYADDWLAGRAASG